MRENARPVMEYTVGHWGTTPKPLIRRVLATCTVRLLLIRYLMVLFGSTKRSLLLLLWPSRGRLHVMGLLGPLPLGKGLGSTMGVRSLPKTLSTLSAGFLTPRLNRALPISS